MPRTKNTLSQQNKSKLSKSSSAAASRRKQSHPTKKRRSHTLREIKYFMQTTHLLIQCTPFGRLVREILQSIHPLHSEIRWQKAALSCLQEATEAYIVGVLADANLCALHSKRVTLMPRDMHLIMRLRGPSM